MGEDLDTVWAELPTPRNPGDAGTRTPSLAQRQRAATTNERATDPDALLQAARACLRRGRTRDAAILMELACDVAPHNVRCRALLAWLRVQRGEVRPAAVGEPLLELLTQAVHQYPGDLELRMYRARALQRLGQAAEAQRDFAYIANADPCNVEAARELRSNPLPNSEKPASSGFFTSRSAGAEHAAPASLRQPRRASSR